MDDWPDLFDEEDMDDYERDSELDDDEKGWLSISADEDDYY